MLLCRGLTAQAVAASDSLPGDRAETLAIRLTCLMYAGRPADAVRVAQVATRSDQSR